MTYRVFWSPHAEQRFERMVQNAVDTANLTTSANEIDRQLVSDPKAFGESRHESVRIGFQPPLAVLFEVMDDVRTVIVFDVWRTDLRH